VEAATPVTQNPDGDGRDNGSSACHTVRAGETMIGIAEQYQTTLSVLAQLNPDPILWNGCNFTQRGGGPNCNPVVVEGACINVPQPTATPTLSPTPSGNETATPTPTYAAPHLIFPADSAVIDAGPTRLQWVSVGVLASDEYYLVEVTDTLTNRYEPLVTKNTMIWLPEDLIPEDGQPHTINWTVSIAVRDPITGVYNRVSGFGQTRTFQWQSR
jgi:hypothetical protein